MRCGLWRSRKRQLERLRHDPFDRSIEVGQQKTRQLMQRLINHMAALSCRPIRARIVLLTSIPDKRSSRRRSEQASKRHIRKKAQMLTRPPPAGTTQPRIPAQHRSLTSWHGSATTQGCRTIQHARNTPSGYRFGKGCAEIGRGADCIRVGGDVPCFCWVCTMFGVPAGGGEPSRVRERVGLRLLDVSWTLVRSWSGPILVWQRWTLGA